MLSLTKRKTLKGGAPLFRGLTRAATKVRTPSRAEQTSILRGLHAVPVIPASNVAHAAILNPLLPIGFETLPSQRPPITLRARLQNPVSLTSQPPTRSSVFTQQRRTVARQPFFNKQRIKEVNSTGPEEIALMRPSKGRIMTFKRRMYPKSFLFTKRKKRLQELLKMKNEARNEISAYIKHINDKTPPNKILSRMIGTSRKSQRSLKDQLITIKFINKKIGSHKVNMKKIVDFLENTKTYNLEKVADRRKLTNIIFPIKKLFRKLYKLKAEAMTILADLAEMSKQSMKSKYPDAVLARKNTYLNELQSKLSKENFEKIMVEIEHVIEEHEIKWSLFVKKPEPTDYNALKGILNDVDNMIPVIKRTNILKTELVSIIRCCFSQPDLVTKKIISLVATPNRRFNQQRILDLREYLKKIVVIRKQMVEKIIEARKNAVDKDMFDKLVKDIEKVNTGFELFIKYSYKAKFSRSLVRAGIGGAQIQSPENVQINFDQSVNMLNYFIDDFTIETCEDLIETKELTNPKVPATVYDASYEDFSIYNDKLIALKQLIKEEIITFLAFDVDENPKTVSNLTHGMKSEQQVAAEAIEQKQEKEQEQE